VLRFPSSRRSTRRVVKRAVRTGALEPVEIATLLSQILSAPSLNDSERKQLRSLQEAIETSAIEQFYGNLPEHPLFLRFIIDEVLTPVFGRATVLPCSGIG